MSDQIRCECCCRVAVAVGNEEAQSDALTRVARELAEVSFDGVAWELRVKPPTIDRDHSPGGGIGEHPLSRVLEIRRAANIWITREESRPVNRGRALRWRKVFQKATAMLAVPMLHELSLVFTIACPGLLQFEEILLWVDGEPVYPVFGLPASRADEIRKAFGVGEGTLRTLSPASTLTWLRGVPGYMLGIGSNRVGRAVSALAHLHQREALTFPLAELAWGIVGLEALFPNKSGDERSFTDRVAAGVSKLLGAQVDIDDAIRSIYRARSEHLHGSQDLPFPHTFPRQQLGDIGEARRQRHETKVAEPLDRAALVATGLLVLCVQRLAEQGKYEAALKG